MDDCYRSKAPVFEGDWFPRVHRWEPPEHREDLAERWELPSSEFAGEARIALVIDVMEIPLAERFRIQAENTPPGFDLTQTLMAGPSGTEGKPVFSDPRLLEELVRRTGLTLQPDGWVKAHTLLGSV